MNQLVFIDLLVNQPIPDIENPRGTYDFKTYWDTMFQAFVLTLRMGVELLYVPGVSCTQ